MGFFTVQYQDVPGRGVIAHGGLKFRPSEKSLRSYFAPILPFVALGDLIGEAVFWLLMPSTVAVWAFPPLLYLTGLPWALVCTLALFVSAQVLHLLVYIKPLNYLVPILANKLLQLVAYALLALTCALTGDSTWAVALAGVFIFFAVGASDILGGILALPVNRLVELPTSDQLLRLIGWYYGRRYTSEDPTKWKMFDETQEPG